MIKFVFGLGNPGAEYENTRHNIGFRVVDLFCKKQGIKTRKDFNVLQKAVCKIGGNELILVKPMTYMNRSGDSVRYLKKKYSITPNDILVVFDEINLPLGKMKLLKGGGHGGHKGMMSLMEEFHGEDIARLRVGIGCPEGTIELSDYVLSEFLPEELSIINKAVEKAAVVIQELPICGIDKMMNFCNTDQD